MNNFNDYFILADSYSVSAKSLFQIIINNGNKLCGVGRSQDESNKKACKLHDTSDAALFIPALFLSFHSIELFIKGMLKMNNVNFNGTHDLTYLLKELEKIYGKKNKVVKSLSWFNKSFFDKLKDFKVNNKITSVNELYEAFRYPDDKSGKLYEYFFLKYNFEKGISYCKTIIGKLDEVRNFVIDEVSKYKERIVMDSE